MTSANPADTTATAEDAPLAYGVLLREETVRIEASPVHTAYYVHPGLLIQHSEYFKRALNGTWKEAEERVIKLDDVECETFELFLEWLYSQQYPQDHRFGEDSNTCKEQLRRLKTCEFGDRFVAPAFRAASESALIDALVVAKEIPYYDAISYAYEHLPADSPRLQALIDQHCYRFQDNLDTEENGELKRRWQLPHAFLVGVMVRYMRLQPECSERKSLDRCDYHGHTSDEKRGKSCKVPRIDKF